MLFPDSKRFFYKYGFEPVFLTEYLIRRYPVRFIDKDLEEVISERVLVNGNKEKGNYFLKKGDQLEYLHLREDEVEIPCDIDVIFEDEWIIAISKPANLPVSPSGRYYFKSLAVYMKEKFDNPEISPLHRLDLETSGVLLFGKNKRARKKIQPLFEKKKMDKTYQAVTFGTPTVEEISGDMMPDEDSKIFSKMKLVPSDNPNSLSIILKNEKWGDYNRVWVKPISGKTNQIRVHLASVGCPIVGDKKYYPDEEIFLDWFVNRDINRILPKIKIDRQALHHEKIAFFSPLTEKEEIIIDLSTRWQQTLEKIL